MKKTFLYATAFAIVALLFASCSQEEPSFDEGLLIGKWQQTDTLIFYTYFADYTGKTWDGSKSEDVFEEEAQPFKWTLDKSDLTQIHIMKDGGEVPQYYTVTELTSSVLRYKDTFNDQYSFRKVNE